MASRDISFNIIIIIVISNRDLHGVDRARQRAKIKSKLICYELGV